MQEVPGAVTVIGMHLIETWLRPGRVGNHLRTDGREIPKNTFEISISRIRAVGAVFHGQKRFRSRRLNSSLPRRPRPFRGP